MLCVRETACSVCCVPVATKAQRAMACDCVLCVCAGGLGSPDGGPTQCQKGWQAVLKTSTWQQVSTVPLNSLHMYQSPFPLKVVIGCIVSRSVIQLLNLWFRDLRAKLVFWTCAKEFWMWWPNMVDRMLTLWCIDGCVSLLLLPQVKPSHSCRMTCNRGTGSPLESGEWHYII